MSEKPPVPAALQTLLLICETDQQRGGDTWGKRLAWQAGIGLGLLLLGFLAGTLIAAVFVASAGIATIARRRGWHNQRRRAGRLVVRRPAGTVDLKRSQACSYFDP